MARPELVIALLGGSYVAGGNYYYIIGFNESRYATSIVKGDNEFKRVLSGMMKEMKNSAFREKIDLQIFDEARKSLGSDCSILEKLVELYNSTVQ